mmetsp:Transcript_1021/g.1211  ORF Transcript_1021/g.1211 Transcript_1021/m.1211 type:complete len:274 (+) Transcript_1021:893-1714(+)
MGLENRAILFTGRDGDLELAAHELEFRVIGRPLTDQFRDRAGVFDLVRGGAGEMVGGHVADGVAGGLDCVQVHLCQRVQHVRHVLQLGPVVLDVLTGSEMAIALVPLFRQQRELAHLVGRQRAIGDRNPQHIGVQLQIQTVHQAQGLELVLGQRAVNAALDLGTELAVALFQEGSVEVVVLIHWLRPPVCRGGSSMGRCGGNLRGNGWARGRWRLPWRRSGRCPQRAARPFRLRSGAAGLRPRPRSAQPATSRGSSCCRRCNRSHRLQAGRWR